MFNIKHLATWYEVCIHNRNIFWSYKLSVLQSIDVVLVMRGSQESLTDLIGGMERGILISRCWYVNFVNPRTLEVTGMTRDGTFWVEDGKIAYPIKNFRFNQNLEEMLKHVEAVSEVQRFGSTVVPGIRVSAFNFTSVSESV